MTHGPAERERSTPSDWSLSALLVLLVVMVFIIYPLSQIGLLPFFFPDIVFSLVVLAGALAVTHKGGITLLVLGSAVAAFLVRWTHRALPDANLAPAVSALSLLFLGVLIAVVVRQVFRKGPVNLHRVQGAVAVYLLLGLLWGFLYELVALFRPDAFSLPATSLPHHVRTPILVYFSFATLTTVGYGDVVAVHPVARSLAMMEALTGQLFPVILIARMVALELETRRAR
jgi:hypothetical protein